MPGIQTSVDLNSVRCQENKAAMEDCIQQWQSVTDDIQLGGSNSAQVRIKAQGKLGIRERLRLLIDKDGPWMELSLFAGYKLYDDALPAGGIITGIAAVSGRLCMIIANDPSVKGGCYFPITIKKHLRAQQIAEENHLPCIYLVDSGGAYLPMQAEVFPDRQHFGRIFYNQARLSSIGIPQISVVMGACTAGGAYIPAMSDQTIMVQEQATIFLGGPPLVKAATGEIVDAETLGGADMHCRRSGVGDYLAKDDNEALMMAREIMQHLPTRPTIQGPQQDAKPPLYPAVDLYALAPTDLRQPVAMRDIIARLVDGSEFNEFKRHYGNTLICGFAYIYGYAVGIIANNGVLFSESALKGTHFIELCCQRNIPLIFLQNVTGFMVGQHVEAEGIAKHGAKMVSAVACANVPKFTVIIGGSFGAGNYAMCGRAYDPRFLMSWPNARISVMGGAQAALVLNEINRDKNKADDPWRAKAQKQSTDHIASLYEKQGHPFYGSARLWDDAIIDPAMTRDHLGLCLRVAHGAPVQATQFGVFRM